MDAKRPASALPAGPVPPMMPIRIAAALHNRRPNPPRSRPPRSGRARDYDHCHGSARRQEHRDHWRPHRCLIGVRGGHARSARKEPDIVLTGAGRALSLTERVARKLPQPVDVFELDVTVPEHLDNVRAALDDEVGPRRRSAARDRFRPRGVSRRRLHGSRRGTTCRSRCTSAPIRSRPSPTLSPR